jgi:hypothetical protein
MDTKGAGVLGVCIIIAALVVSLVPRNPPPGIAAEVGRYQFGRSNGVNCFVLDTKTGRLWERFVETSGGSPAWSENKAPWAETQGK